MCSKIAFSPLLAFPLIALLSTGCAFIPRQADTPLEVLSHPWQNGEQQPRLIVYLPGRYDKIEDFEKRGLLEDLRNANIPADILSLDAHLGYYINRSIVRRIRQEVLIPARDAGYQEIWAVGNSMGGLGALLTEKQYPNSWDKMILLAPFLGNDKKLFQEIDAVGGPEKWSPPTPRLEDEGFARSLWYWLKDYKRDASNRPEILIGYGDADKLAPAIKRFAPLLPAENVLALEGGHKWTVWRPLWQQLLKTPALNTH